MSTTTNKPGVQFLNKHTVEDALTHTWKRDHVVCTKEDARVWQAMKALADSRLHAIPVVSAEHGLTGMCTLSDILCFVLKVAPDILKLKEEERANLFKNFNAFADATVAEVLQASRTTSPFYLTAHIGDSLAKDAWLLTKGIAYILVFTTDDSHFTHVLTPSSILTYISTYMTEIPIFEQKTLRDLSLVTGSVITVEKTMPVLTVLTTLNAHEVGAVAVVDNNGTLVGNFSTSDLRGLYQEYLPRLMEPVHEYLLSYSPGSLKPRTVTPDVSFAKAVAVAVTHRIHHLWVVDEGNKPVGVVSLGDMLKAILETEE